MNRILTRETTNQLELFQANEIVRPDINIGKWAPLIFSSPYAKDLYQTKRIEIPTGDKAISASITITPLNEKKRPTLTSQKLLFALIQLWEEQGKDPYGRVTFSARQIASILEWTWAGRDTAERIQEQLIILNGSVIDWKRSFLADGMETTEVDGMNLIDAKSYLQRQDMINREFFSAQHKVRLNLDLVQNMLSGHTKPIRFKELLSIKSDAAATLYNMLDNFLSGKPKWERRATALIYDDLELTGKRYEKKFARHAKLKEFVETLQGKELSTGILSLKVERTVDDEDYKLVAYKERTKTPPKRRFKYLGNLKDIPFIIEDIREGLSQLGPTGNIDNSMLKTLAKVYPRQMLFDALALVKADYRGRITKTPMAAYMYQVHIIAHQKALDWISECDASCPKRRKPLKSDR